MMKEILFVNKDSVSGGNLLKMEEVLMKVWIKKLPYLVFLTYIETLPLKKICLLL